MFKMMKSLLPQSHMYAQVSDKYAVSKAGTAND